MASSCVLQTAPPPAPAPEPEPLEAPTETHHRTIELEDGTLVEVGEGIERGFYHCCGDLDYMMEVDCSEMLLRCYKQNGRRWKQTYGKYCKQNLSEECYGTACTDVCEAVVSDREWQR